MLNRRILRVKAFQNLYAFQQCKSSNLNLAKDFIHDSFQPDLDSMEVQDKSKLKDEAKTAVALFSKNLNHKELIASGDHSTKIKSTAIKAVNLFHQNNQKDLEFLRKNMVSAAENIPHLYLNVIQILIGFADHVGNEYEKKRKLNQEAISGTSGELNLAQNQVLDLIRKSPAFTNETTRQQASTEELELEIQEWYREYVKPFEPYQQYIQLNQPSLEQDLDILTDITKKVLFKNEAILSYFAEKDLSWSENKAVVRSLALKMLKNAKECSGAEDYELPEIAINWEEDKEFFQNIFNLTIENDEENRKLIAEKTKNWDIERIASTDKIIISMALAEMTFFPSIPVKVTINEYIDISKTYSTPKSKQFVNGLLDVLAKELTDQGKIRKSGRGLLDNK
ncbi:transcription antitermination factor NusB [Echinicola jeungdonensis]|uniref:Transcription antitermination factor NusB n=1 Tax=Echinicola jeungdonensis TaxID=709343 RepID=A0ABV5J591_9BACT|nr:transcription antitermination factor NusB [Echinicola jeungdonensis]MDN3668662.1 transcription antitermination factor NusB [Echinicola jeungdonensis]